MSPTRRLSRRRLLSAALGAAGIAVTVGAAAGCTGAPEDNDPPEPSSSPDESLLWDDIADGVVVEDRGFATFPVQDGNATRRIVGAAAVFRNMTDQPKRIHVRFMFVDDEGRGWRSGQLNDWEAIVNASWAYLPAQQAVEFGGVLQVDADQAARVARIVLYVIDEGLPVKPSVLLPAKIGELKPRPTPKAEWDYVTFDVDNPGFDFAKPNYGMVFRSADGRLIGGWFVDRANWWDIGSALPKDETDEYPRGVSGHTLPAWLPPGIQPNGVTMYVWPR